MGRQGSSRLSVKIVGTILMLSISVISASGDHQVFDSSRLATNNNNNPQEEIVVPPSDRDRGSSDHLQEKFGQKESIISYSFRLIESDRLLVESIRAVVGSLEGPGCRRDLNATLNAIDRREPWAIAMLDSSAKSASGIEYGSVYQFGHFDQCLAINENRSAQVLSQYCLADVQLDGYRVRADIFRHPQTDVNASVLIHWGICVPAACSEPDVVRIVRSTTGVKEVGIPSNGCYRNRQHGSPSALDITYVTVMLFFVLMVLVSTVYHLSTIYGTKSGKETTAGYVLRSFSVVENLRKLVQDSKDDHGLGCINGIKAVSMLFILGGHSLLFMAGGAAYNPGFHGEQIKLLHNAFLANSPLLVDTFLLLSGFLFARLLLIELDKRRGRVNFLLLYIFRYIRLTPAYAAIIALYATWLPRLGSGPLWNQRMMLEQARCRASWWLNALYINNYIGTDQLCMFQSWYLAADSQLFVLAPLLLYPLWKIGRRAGFTLIGVVAVVSMVIPFAVTYFGKLDPTFMIYPSEVTDPQANFYYTNVYVKTHMRTAGYVFGIFVGYLVHLMQQKNITIGKRKLIVCWTLSIAIGVGSMFGLSAFYNSTGTENYLANAIYAALHRLGWSLSNGWLVLACVTGHGGPLKKFLSSQVFVPISRLTYCAYLTNGLVELYFSASQREPLYASVVSMTGEALSHVSITFLAALGLCLLFESPIHGLEKILLRRQRPSTGRPLHHNDTSEEKTSEADSHSTNNTQSTSDDSSR
ncbi:nose resistant to fluoxetine protein 6-like isoform X2 [Uranotaenia lowii]|uniref:nose resistant to fluoxetine protein 6-like isoform X2 n=1 Tax=Uranotaenia lowii TaxID=190385 RepID=UPI002479FC85|nr:nose resistant to fluoxetine protein 6-like isoform X2 [Uranotaenia lowii]